MTPDTTGSLDGKVAIVTGGNSGIGEAIVRALAAAGAKVIIDWVAHPEETDALCRELASAGHEAVGVQADVSRVADLRTLVGTAVERFGRLDIMVNNAGIETRTTLLESTEDDFEKVIAVNLKSAFFGTQLAAKQMVAQGEGGRIINISSIHEDQPMPGNVPYCLSKGGTRMLTRSAGVELGPHGITVVGVAPGAVATPINQVELDDPEIVAKFKVAVPIGRVAEPEEIADVVAFLASGGAGYLTATTVTVDGGMTQQSYGI